MRFFNTLIDVLYVAAVISWVAIVSACVFFTLVFFLV
jgi:hypothetical protein